MVTGPDGTIRYLSPSVERVLGYAPEEMVGTSTAEYVHPEDVQRARGELEALLTKPGVYPEAVETRVRHKDGSWRHLEGMATNLLDDPAVEGLVFNQRDVTERVRAEEEVRRLNSSGRARSASGPPSSRPPSASRTWARTAGGSGSTTSSARSRATLARSFRG